jgi:hypothetical protein
MKHMEEVDSDGCLLLAFRYKARFGVGGAVNGWSCSKDKIQDFSLYIISKLLAIRWLVQDGFCHGASSDIASHASNDTFVTFYLPRQCFYLLPTYNGTRTPTCLSIAYQDGIAKLTGVYSFVSKDRLTILFPQEKVSQFEIVQLWRNNARLC